MKKLAGLWLAGEVVNHVGIYGSKAAEGLSAFQRRSCYDCQCWILVVILMAFNTSLLSAWINFNPRMDK